MPDLGMCGQKPTSTKLQVLQNRALRIILNYPRYIVRKYLHNDANIQPLNERIRTLAENFHSQISSHPNASISSQANAITTGSLEPPNSLYDSSKHLLIQPFPSSFILSKTISLFLPSLLKRKLRSIDVLRFAQNKFELLPPQPAQVRREERISSSSSAHLRHNADQLICHFLPPATEEREKKPSPVRGECYVMTQFTCFSPLPPPSR
ncbi:hypothetical protein TNCV_603951 [Trichonephila clavipes]|nr:hypothetical protein TNCV_603951 [Trichonephila clavipes]